MGLFSGYNNAGSGIPKMPQDKRGFTKYIEIFGRHFWDLVFLNLLYLVFCIPIITIGPATAGLIRVTRNYSQERACFMFHEFWKTFKSSFKQSFFVGILDLFLVFWAIFMVTFYYQVSLAYSFGKVLFVIAISMILVIFLMHFYIYLLIVSTKLKLKQIIKNSFLLVSIGVKETIASFFTIVALVIFITVIMFMAGTIGMFVAMGLVAALLFSACAFIVCCNCYPVVRKYVIQPYYNKRGEKNPEFDDEDPDNNEEAIFEDKGGSEAPVAIPKSRVKGNSGASQGKKKGSKSKGSGKRIS